MDINYKKNGAAEINGMIKAAVEDRSPHSGCQRKL